MAIISGEPGSPLPERKPASTPEVRENQMIALAVDLAEEQIRSGTASAQVITHYLKLATRREALERENLERKNELLRIQAETQEAAKRMDVIYEEALNAMREYSGGE